MKRTISARNLDAFKARYERDGVSDMTPDQWGDWVNALPVPEFMAMLTMSDTRKTKPKGKKIDRAELCTQLAGIAAFQLYNKPTAQGILNEAIRAIHGGNN